MVSCTFSLQHPSTFAFPRPNFDDESPKRSHRTFGLPTHLAPRCPKKVRWLGRHSRSWTEIGRSWISCHGNNWRSPKRYPQIIHFQKGVSIVAIKMVPCAAFLGNPHFFANQLKKRVFLAGDLRLATWVKHPRMFWGRLEAEGKGHFDDPLDSHWRRPPSFDFFVGLKACGWCLNRTFNSSNVHCGAHESAARFSFTLPMNEYELVFLPQPCLLDTTADCDSPRLPWNIRTEVHEWLWWFDTITYHFPNLFRSYTYSMIILEFSPSNSMFALWFKMGQVKIPSSDSLE